MKLLFFIHSLRSGGAERVAVNLANHWAEKGWDTIIVTLAPRSSDFYELHRAIVRVSLELESSSSNVFVGLAQNLRRVSGLRRVLRQFAPDIAVSMMTTANVLLALATWRLPQPTIGSEHTHPPAYPLGVPWEALRRRTYGLLTAVTALTRESADWLRTHTNARKVVVIPNAAVWPLPSQPPRVAPIDVCRVGCQLLLAVGRLDVHKRFDLLIDAFVPLAQKYPRWDLVILGEGSQRTTLESQVRATGLEERVRLPGRVGNVGEWYESADLYVMSSRFEGFPNTLVEAMAHGLAAVSSDCDTGPRDIIRDGVDGMLVPAEDGSGLTAALDRLMGDADLRELYAIRAVDARERFSIEKIANMWEVLFDDATKGESR